jgi:hypothetical protein
VLRVGVVGDYDSGNETHRATDAALVHAAASLGATATGEWVATEKVGAGGAGELEGFDCLLIAPASPYRSTEGALTAIRYARTSDIPLLGTCGGNQGLSSCRVYVSSWARSSSRKPRAPCLLPTRSWWLSSKLRKNGSYSHSIVPGGLLVMSRTTRFTSLTSLVIRVETRARTS